MLVNTVRLDEAGLAALDALGRVRDVVRLGAFHGRDDAFYRARYGARLWAVPGSAHADGLAADRELVDGGELPLVGARALVFRSSRHPEAALLLERAGGVLVTCDAVQNWTGIDPYFSPETGAQFEAGGLLRPANVPSTWTHACAPAAADFARLLTLPFRHLVTGHGPPLVDAAHAAVTDGVRRAFRRPRSRRDRIASSRRRARSPTRRSACSTRCGTPRSSRGGGDHTASPAPSRRSTSARAAPSASRSTARAGGPSRTSSSSAPSRRRAGWCSTTCRSPPTSPSSCSDPWATARSSASSRPSERGRVRRLAPWPARPTRRTRPPRGARSGRRTPRAAGTSRRTAGSGKPGSTASDGSSPGARRRRARVRMMAATEETRAAMAKEGHAPSHPVRSTFRDVRPRRHLALVRRHRLPAGRRPLRALTVDLAVRGDQVTMSRCIGCTTTPRRPCRWAASRASSGSRRPLPLGRGHPRERRLPATCRYASARARRRPPSPSPGGRSTTPTQPARRRRAAGRSRRDRRPRARLARPEAAAATRRGARRRGGGRRAWRSSSLAGEPRGLTWETRSFASGKERQIARSRSIGDGERAVDVRFVMVRAYRPGVAVVDGRHGGRALLPERVVRRGDVFWAVVPAEGAQDADEGSRTRTSSCRTTC